MTKLTKFFLVLLTIVFCVGCDQTTKAVAKAHLSRTEAASFAGDTLRLQYAENPSAFLSLGSSLPKEWRRLIFTGATAIFLGLLVMYMLFVSSVSPLSVVSLSLIAGGGLSNLLDRIAYNGYVVDFINVGFGTLRTGIFNVADMAITLGAILIMVSTVKRRRKRGC